MLRIETCCTSRRQQLSTLSTLNLTVPFRYPTPVVFDPDSFRRRPGRIVYEDRFRQVEMGIGFKKIVCSRCDFPGFYKYQAQEIRRREEILTASDEEARPDHLDMWETVPRFAEIPQTLKCKRCREVLGTYVFCIY